MWVKMTVNRRLAKSHGFYLQHAKEVCLVGKRGQDPPGMCSGVGSDIIYRCVSLAGRRLASQAPRVQWHHILACLPGGSVAHVAVLPCTVRQWPWALKEPRCACAARRSERRGQSQKPEEVYQLVEKLVPGGARCAALCCAVDRRQGHA